ncbi:MAG: DUF692 family multinuclear iron-containing protein [Kofleriaceae bacterium]
MTRSVGLVYTPALDALIRTPGLVDVVEIEPEMFWIDESSVQPDAWKHIASITQPKLVHGVGPAIGGVLAPPAHYVQMFARCCRELGAQWASHHLAFNRFANGTAAGFFLPPRQTADGVVAASASIRTLASALACPFAIETGVNYLRPRDDEMPDGEFVASVARDANCHILLDLHNLWCNARNGRQQISEYLAALPLDRVIEVHVAGGFAVDNYWLDAHSGVPPRELFDVLADVAPLLSNARTVVLEVLGPFAAIVGADAIEASLADIRAIWIRPMRTHFVGANPSVPITTAIACGSVGAAEWEDALGGLVIGAAPDTPLAHELATDPAIRVLATLVVQARAGMIADGLPVTLRLLLVALGESATTQLMEQYCRETTPSAFGAGELASFATWLAARSIEIPHLDSALRFDIASAQVEAIGVPEEILMSIDPTVLVDSLRRTEMPPSTGETYVVTVR